MSSRDVESGRLSIVVVTFENTTEPDRQPEVYYFEAYDEDMRDCIDGWLENDRFPRGARFTMDFLRDPTADYD